MSTAEPLLDDRSSSPPVATTDYYSSGSFDANIAIFLVTRLCLVTVSQRLCLVMISEFMRQSITSDITRQSQVTRLWGEWRCPCQV